MQTEKPIMAIVGVAVFCLALAVQAQTAASSRYRVEGTVTPAGAGRSSQAALLLYQIVAQPEPLGDAAGSVGTVLQGWRLPAPVEPSYRYTLQAGWNLQGAPGDSDQTTGQVFTGSGGAPIKVGNIQYLTPADTLIEADDADPIVGLQAFWVFSYWGGSGRLFATPEAHTPDDGTAWQDLLQYGWNLFSPPYTVAVPSRGSIVAAWRWDAATASYEVVPPGAELRPLEGYWILKISEDY